MNKDVDYFAQCEIREVRKMDFQYNDNKYLTKKRWIILIGVR